MANVFISYSRKDKEFVRRVHESLHAQGRDIWVDWEDIPATATWWEEICQGIDGADSFLFVISPDSVGSKVCNQELEYAIEHHKRLIPVVYREAEPQSMNPALAQHNWLYLRESDNFDTEFKRLITALDTDLDYVHEHTRLLVRAKEWEQNSYNTSFVLRGSELKESEVWLAQSGSKEPKPTELQIRYIVSSRGASSRFQRVILGAVTTALLIALGLSFFAITQRNLALDAQATAVSVGQTAIAERDRANIEAGRALSRQIALIVRNMLDFRAYDVALLLSVEANRASQTKEALTALSNSLRANPHLLLTLADYSNAQFSADGKILRAQKADGTFSYWSTVTGKPVAALATFKPAPEPTPISTPIPSAEAVANPPIIVPSPNGKSRAVIRNNTLTITDATGEPVNTLLENRDGLDFGKLIYSPDSNKVAVYFCADAVGGFGCLDDQIHLFSVLTGEILGTPLERLRDTPSSIVFSPSGDKLVVGYEDGYLIAYDGSNLQTIATQQVGDGTQPVTALTFSNDGVLLAGFASERLEGKVFIAEMQESPLQIVQDIPLSIPLNLDELRLAFSPDNKALLTDYGSSYVKEGLQQVQYLWAFSEAQLPDRTRTLAVPQTLYFSVAFTPDGKTLALGENGKVLLWNMQDSKAIATVTVRQEQPIIRLAYSPDAQWLAVGTADSSVSLWQVSTLTSATPVSKVLAEKIIDADNFDNLTSLLFSADSQTVFASALSGTIVRWETATGKEIGRIKLEPSGTGLFLMDGKVLGYAASISQLESTSTVHDAATGAMVNITLPWQSAGRSSYSVLPVFQDITNDGQWVIRADCESGSTTNLIACYGGKINIFHTMTGIATPRQLFSGTDMMLAATISPDQQFVVGTNQDGFVYVWELYLLSPLERACAIANRNLTSTEWGLYLPDQTQHETCPVKK